MAEPVSTLLKWLISEQGDVTGLEISEETGIATQTWSKARQGKQDLSSDLLWRAMVAIARRRPGSDVAKVVNIIEGGNSKRKKTDPPLLRLERGLDALDELLNDEDEEEALLLIARQLRRSRRRPRIELIS